MAFRFRLETVLRFRDSVEKREELALRKALQDVARTRALIERIGQEIAAAQDARNTALEKTLAASQLQSVLRDIDAAIARRKALIDSLPGLERQCEMARKAYQAAHRDRQMLSDMEAKQQEEYAQERVRKEQKFIDDVFAARAQRS